MGTFTYDSSVRIEVEDSHLAHLELVILAKLRRSESFVLSWTRPLADGGGRSSIWLHPATPLSFNFDSPVMPQISRRWIEKMTVAANSNRGLRLSSDPDADDDEDTSPLAQYDLTDPHPLD